MDNEQEYGSFELVIDFKKGSGDPSRVFKTMSGLIESVQSLDNHLSQSLIRNVKTTLVLQDIQAGSLKARLRNIVEEIPDEALKQGKIQPIIGHFLVRAKHKAIDWCADKNEIIDKNEIKQLQSGIKQIAAETDIKQIPMYAEPDAESLLLDINSIRNSLITLEDDDYVNMQSDQGISNFNKRMGISTDLIREYLTKEKITSEGEKILKVKKPDYLGTSMWSFKYQNKAVDAKIVDEKWLKDFQSKNITLLPGDSIRAFVREEVSYGHNNEVIHLHFEILQVLEILHEPKQMLLLK